MPRSCVDRCQVDEHRDAILRELMNLSKERKEHKANPFDEGNKEYGFMVCNNRDCMVIHGNSDNIPWGADLERKSPGAMFYHNHPHARQAILSLGDAAVTYLNGAKGDCAVTESGEFMCMTDRSGGGQSRSRRDMPEVLDRWGNYNLWKVCPGKRESRRTLCCYAKELRNIGYDVCVGELE